MALTTEIDGCGGGVGRGDRQAGRGDRPRHRRGDHRLRHRGAPALAGRVVASVVDFTASNGRGLDRYGHGTHVAGIVARGRPSNDTGEAPVGMAPGAHSSTSRCWARRHRQGERRDRGHRLGDRQPRQHRHPDHQPVARRGADAELARRSAVPGGGARGARGHGSSRRRATTARPTTASWCWAA